MVLQPVGIHMCIAFFGFGFLFILLFFFIDWVTRDYAAAIVSFSKAFDFKDYLNNYPTTIQLNFYSSLSFAGFI